MKLARLAAWILAIGSAVSPTVAGPGLTKYTAEYYLAEPSKYEGKEIKLYVSHVQPKSYKEGASDMVYFYAYTAYNGKSGGWITLACPKGLGEKMIKRYGTSYEYDNTGKLRASMLKGTFSTTPLDNYCVVVRDHVETKNDDDE